MGLLDKILTADYAAAVPFLEGLGKFLYQRIVVLPGVLDVGIIGRGDEPREAYRRTETAAYLPHARHTASEAGADDREHLRGGELVELEHVRECKKH